MTQRTTASATTTIGSRYLTFGPSPVAVVKILALYNSAAGTYPPPILNEITPDQMLAEGVVGDPPTLYAVTNMGERTVTVQLNAIPATAYALTADVEGNVTQLSGALSPAFSEDYHDILVNMVCADELEKQEKYDKAKEKMKQAEARMGALRLFIAKSAYKDMVQGARGSNASTGSGGGSSNTVSGWPALTAPVSATTGSLLVATATNVIGTLADAAVGQVLASAGVGVVPAYTASPSLTAVTLSTPLAATSGGSGFASYAVGDLLYASTTTALSKLAGVATGKALLSGGVGVAPAWGQVGLTTHVTGTLPAANGGTGQATYVVGDLLYASTTTALSRLAAVAVGRVLVDSGAGVAPTWHASFTVTAGGTTSFAPHTVSVASGALLSLNNSGADAGVTNQSYISFQTAGATRYFVGMSAASATGNFDFYDNIDGYNAVTITKGTGVLGALKGLAVTGTVTQTGKTTTYNNVATAGWGVPAIQAAGRSTAQIAAVASVATYTVGAADGTFEVSANVLVTTATTHSFSVTCAYTDEGNTARTLTLSFTLVAGGAFTTLVANGNGTVPYMGLSQHIRCKTGTTITIATTGTFTTVTYNVEGLIRQLA